MSRYGVATAIELYELAVAMLEQRLAREHPTWSRAAITGARREMATQPTMLTGANRQEPLGNAASGLTTSRASVELSGESSF